MSYWKRCLITCLSVMVLLLMLAACKPTAQTITDYHQARDVFWQSLYVNGGQTLYCGQIFDHSRPKGINIEHVFPMSWAKNGLNCGTRKQCRQRSVDFNKIEADLHNLYPSLSHVNQQRSSFRFGNIKGEKRAFGQYCDFEVNRHQRVAEPAPKVRGDVARAMFYMAYRYQDLGLKLYVKQAAILFAWHQADPPMQAEIKRNNKIERLQGNRNPFIDDPEKLDVLFKQRFFAI